MKNIFPLIIIIFFISCGIGGDPNPNRPTHEIDTAQMRREKDSLDSIKRKSSFRSDWDESTGVVSIDYENESTLSIVGQPVAGVSRNMGDSLITDNIGEKYFTFKLKPIPQKGVWAVQEKFDGGLFQYRFYDGYLVSMQCWYKGNLVEDKELPAAKHFNQKQ